MMKFYVSMTNHEPDDLIWLVQAKVTRKNLDRNPETL